MGREQVGRIGGAWLLSTNLSLAEPHPPSAQARGSGCKPISSFVPAARILQSNQIAERPITECRHVNVTTLVVFTLQGYVSHGSVRSSAAKELGSVSRAKVRAVRSCGDICEGTVDVVWRSHTHRARKREGLVASLYQVLYLLQEYCSPIRLQNDQLRNADM